MSRLYLIRKAYETYLGPFTASELESGFKHLEIVLGDEITGNLGPWVQLENQKQLMRYYPDLCKIFYKEIEPELSLSGDEKVKKVRVSSKHKNTEAGKKKKSSDSMIITYAVGAAVLILLLFIFRWSIWMVIPNNLSRFNQKFERLEKSSNRDQTTAFVKDNLGIISLLVKKDGTYLAKYLPYLRLLAFNGNGEISGLESKVLAGDLESEVPDDCSLSAWNDYFDQWRALGMGVERLADLQSKSYVKLLFIDRGWMERRKGLGWIEPKNHYQLCLKMALQSLEQSASSSKFNAQDKDQQMILMRLRHLNRTKASLTDMPNHPFAYISCLEDADNLELINNCLGRYQQQQKWQNSLRSRSTLSMITSLFSSPNINDRDEIRGLLMEMELSPSDTLSGMDLTAEVSLLMQLKNGEKPQVAAAAIEMNYPTIKFK